MIRHGDFAKWLYEKFPATEPARLNDILVRTSKGVAPEVISESAFKVLSLLANQPDTWLDFTPQPIPVKPPPVEVAHPTFKLGERSLNRLATLKLELRQTVELAITFTATDFTVLQTIRSFEEQKKAVAAGHSRTMKSKHLPQADGFAHAVDLGAWVNGAVSWSESYYADIAFAMDQAATKLGFASNVRWGAAWDRVLSDFGVTRDAYLAEARAYAKRHAGSDLIDMPHFEWVS